MAILGHFEASVSINGAAAQEYDDDEDGSGNPNVVSKYIEVVSGENFEVNFKVKKHYNFTCDYFGWNISLDGDQKCGPVIDKSHYSWDHGKSNSRNGVRIKKGDQFSLSKFKFDDLTISEYCLAHSANDSDRKPRRRSKPSESTGEQNQEPGDYHH